MKLASRVAPVVTVPTPDRRQFGQEIAFLGYDVPASAALNKPLMITLYWQALATPARDYSVFIHLIDNDGRIVAQQDGPPAEGSYPTSLWSAAEIISDSHELQLPPSLAPGDYHIRLGLYNPTDGIRVPVLDDAGQTEGDAIDLPAVRIEG